MNLAKEELRRRLKNAKRRALYWSGIPFRTKATEDNFKYEIAMNDIESLSGYLEDLTGKKVPVVDVRQEFRQRWSKLTWSKK